MHAMQSICRSLGIVKAKGSDTKRPKDECVPRQGFLWNSSRTNWYNHQSHLKPNSTVTDLTDHTPKRWYHPARVGRWNVPTSPPRTPQRSVIPTTVGTGQRSSPTQEKGIANTVKSAQTLRVDVEAANRNPRDHGSPCVETVERSGRPSPINETGGPTERPQIVVTGCLGFGGTDQGGTRRGGTRGDSQKQGDTESDRQRDRQGGTRSGSQKQGDTESDSQRDREGGTRSGLQKQGDTESDRQRDRQGGTQSGSQKQGDTESDSQRDRQADKRRDTQRARRSDTQKDRRGGIQRDRVKGDTQTQRDRIRGDTQTQRDSQMNCRNETQKDRRSASRSDRPPQTNNRESLVRSSDGPSHGERSRREAERKRNKHNGKEVQRPRATPSRSHQKPSTRPTDRRGTLAVLEAKEVTMLARATKALQEHMKDMTEKTKTTCCVPAKLAEKENLQNIQNFVIHQDPQPSGYIMDNTTGTTFLKGKLLGKGGFAKCYELTDQKTGKCYAGKIISKNRLSKPHQKEKIAREVELHKRLNHPHVVGFHSYFEDNDNVYIILELCSRKSLVHVLKNRKTVTETEVRFYLRQLIDGCRYIHSQKIIHRDLKLGNMLLNDNMNIKIADFGLATRVEYDGEKKMTVCGTPNYIAPEVLQKKGHSYEADIWAMGCVMYALLFGRPPFETTTLKETYSRITSNKYTIPNNVSPAGRNLIESLLTSDPAQRPSLDKILQHEFFGSGYLPNSLPTSCYETAPKFPPQFQRPKSYAAPVTPAEAMHKITTSLAQLKSPHVTTPPPASINPSTKPRTRARSPSPVTKTTSSTVMTTVPTVAPSTVTRNPPTSTVTRPSSTGSSTGSELSSHSSHSRPSSIDLKALPIGSSIRLYQLLTSCLDQMPQDANPSVEHNTKPLWVTKWVDYSNKYGFGFQLSDKSVGVLFNDTTRMLLSPDGRIIQYNDLSNKVYTFATDSHPREYGKKATLLLYFAQYMDEHLIHGGDILAQRPALACAPAGCATVGGTGIFMKKWFRTGKAIVMYLNSGTLQVNFFDDHTKVILSPDGQDYLVTYINTHRQAVTYRLLQFRHFGCNPDIQERLHYARNMLASIINIEGESV